MEYTEHTDQTDYDERTEYTESAESADHLEHTEHAVLHPHGHYHDPAEKKRQINRLARIIGHLNHIKKMIEADEDCSAVLMQLAATKSALNGLGKEITHEHISHCITHALEDHDTEILEDFLKAMHEFF